MAERGELLRGLRQAKVFNDELAKVRLRATCEREEPRQSPLPVLLS